MFPKSVDPNRNDCRRNKPLLTNKTEMKICIVSGARPDFMKIAPLVRAIERYRQEGKELAFDLVYTGTRIDKNLETTLFEDLGMPAPSIFLEVETNEQIERLAGIMLAFDNYLKNNPVNTVVVVGDLTPTMACTLVAKKRNVQVAHLAAGTRSFDLTTPKEINQVITDALSDYFFTAGMVSNRNLNNSGTENNRVHFVGNILMDSIRYNRKRFCKPLFFDRYGLKERQYLLFTLNQRALLHRPHLLEQLLATLLENSGEIPIVAPLQEHSLEVLQNLSGGNQRLLLLPSQSYLCFSYLVENAKAIVTDSGNIAEEATFLSVPCITLNSFSEHPETCTLGTNELVGEDPLLLASALERVMKGEWKSGRIPERWDGYTAERIVQTLYGSL